ncbi:MAG: hydantoinase B/oxoprolinase family protein [Armatimonadetes bacterium]|nr:hydantoinase B/oxoprolinase family protein [Armatimonadota bacterium]
MVFHLVVTPFSLEIFKNLFCGIPEEMGAVLCRTGLSANIRERRDFSCALFDSMGRLLAQAAHIPVHLGSMPLLLHRLASEYAFSPGDVILVNDPFSGGTHLPDLTLVSSFNVGRKLSGFLAVRAHHADIGGAFPGSMGLSGEIYSEGVRIPPVYIVKKGKTDRDLLNLLLSNCRSPEERKGDLHAQLAALKRGEARFKELIARYGLKVLKEHTRALLQYSETLTREALRRIPGGTYRAVETLDGDGVQKGLILRVKLVIGGGEVMCDFSGTAAEGRGCLNAPLPVTCAAVYYVFRCLIGDNIPANEGCFRPIRIHVPPGCLLNAGPPRAVAGGNVETSQRVVDLLLLALSQALPGLIPAASCGTMNNLSLGWEIEGREDAGSSRDSSLTYYETIGGGAGAGPEWSGDSGVQTHMTNTRNSPVEWLEILYPLRILRYALRGGSGGSGRLRGGEGVVKEFEFLAPTRVSMISERRESSPYGLAGGGSGAPGANLLQHRGQTVKLPAKFVRTVDKGDHLIIETPGGGGWGKIKPQSHGGGKGTP